MLCPSSSSAAGLPPPQSSQMVTPKRKPRVGTNSSQKVRPYVKSSKKKKMSPGDAWAAAIKDTRAIGSYFKPIPPTIDLTADHDNDHSSLDPAAHECESCMKLSPNRQAASTPSRQKAASSGRVLAAAAAAAAAATSLRRGESDSSVPSSPRKRRQLKQGRSSGSPKRMRASTSGNTSQQPSDSSPNVSFWPEVNK